MSDLVDPIRPLKPSKSPDKINLTDVAPCLDDLDQVKVVLEEYALPLEATTEAEVDALERWESARQRKAATVALWCGEGEFNLVETLRTIPRDGRTYFHMTVGYPRPYLSVGFESGGRATITYTSESEACSVAAKQVAEIVNRRKRRVTLRSLRWMAYVTTLVSVGFTLTATALSFAGHALPLPVWVPLIPVALALQIGGYAVYSRARFGPTVRALRRRQIEERDHQIGQTIGIAVLMLAVSVLGIVLANT